MADMSEEEKAEMKAQFAEKRERWNSLSEEEQAEKKA
jgi:hypothetical protein